MSSRNGLVVNDAAVASPIAHTHQATGCRSRGSLAAAASGSRHAPRRRRRRAGAAKRTRDHDRARPRPAARRRRPPAGRRTRPSTSVGARSAVGSPRGGDRSAPSVAGPPCFGFFARLRSASVARACRRLRRPPVMRAPTAVVGSRSGRPSAGRRRAAVGRRRRCRRAGAAAGVGVGRRGARARAPRRAAAVPFQANATEPPVGDVQASRRPRWSRSRCRSCRRTTTAPQ